MSTALETRRPPRQLGVRMKPALRLKMGYRDEARKNAPVKTEYFIPSFGRENCDRRAAEKFTEVYGEKPKAVEILLPTELHHALTIQYKAWGGGGEDGDGVLKAIGHTNFALETLAGGADVLTVWNPDGTVEQVEIEGLDDPKARELGVELYTTLRFNLPRVLSFGSFAEITSRGKETTDNLWSKLREWYGLFGPRITLALRPQLVMRPSTARPVVEKNGERKRIKSKIYVLDVISPESIEETLLRLRESGLALGGGSDVLGIAARSEVLERPAALGPAPDVPVEGGDVPPKAAGDGIPRATEEQLDELASVLAYLDETLGDAADEGAAVRAQQWLLDNGIHVEHREELTRKQTDDLITEMRRQLAELGEIPF